MYDNDRDYDDERLDRNSVRLANNSDSKSATALKAAGFRRSNRWWLTPEQWEMTEYMAKQNLEEIQRIKDRVHGRR